MGFYPIKERSEAILFDTVGPIQLWIRTTFARMSSSYSFLSPTVLVLYSLNMILLGKMLRKLN